MEDGLSVFSGDLWSRFGQQCEAAGVSADAAGDESPGYETPGSAVSIFPVEDAFDLEAITLVAKENPVVLSAEPDQGRDYALELFGRTFAGQDIAPQGL